MSYQPGPKELAMRAMREQNVEANAKRNKACAAELRKQVDEVRARPPKPTKASNKRKGK